MKITTLLIRQFRLIMGLSLLSALSFTSYAQDHVPISPNPEVWGQMRYGGTNSVNHFRGEVGASVPIYTYEDPDFKIPISLSYGSGGWMPDIESGIVGKGWTLNLGGFVTRTVRGLPDDKTLQVPEFITQMFRYPNFSRTIFYYGYAQAYNYSPNIAQDNDFAEANSYPHPFPILGTNWHALMVNNPNPMSLTETFTETTPDLFRFRFGEHYGCFMLKPNGGMNIFNLSQPDVNYTITLTGFTPQTNNWNDSSKEIKITTGDGYSYIFGAHYLSKHDYQTMDESESLVTSGLERPYPFDAEYNVTWPLTKIVAPNGRTVAFEYDVVIREKTFGDAGLYVERKFYAGSTESSYPSYIENDNHYSGTGTQIASILRNIIIDGSANIALEYNQNKVLLKSITISSLLGSNSTPQKYEFAYNDNTNKDMSFLGLLGRIISPSGSQHKFEYYNGNNIQFMPSDESGFAYDPNQAAYAIGMLSRITYPTGGETRYYYEANTYSHYVDKHILTNKPGIAHGVRISKITDYTSPTDSVWRSYVYGDSDVQGYFVSTLLTREKTAPVKFVHKHHINSITQIDYQDYLRFINYRNSTFPTYPMEVGMWNELLALEYLEWKKNRGYWGGYGELFDYDICYVKEIQSKDPTSYSYSKWHLEYPLVTEHFSDGSKIEYRFTSYKDWPNLSESYYHSNTPATYRVHFMIDFITSSYPPLFWCRYYMAPINNDYSAQEQWCEAIDYSHLRGKLSSMKVYAANSSTPSLQKEIEYNFILHDHFGGYKKGIYSFIGTRITGNVNYPWKTKTTEYLDSGTITSEVLTEYSDKLKKISTKQSNGKTTIVEYFYPENLKSTQIHQKMISQNMTNIPIRIITSVKENDSAPPYITGAIENVYSEVNNKIHLTETKQANIDRPLTSPNVNINSYLTDGVKFKYCNKGRIIEVTDQNGAKTTIIWGYRKTYVIAELRNCSFEEVQAAFTYSNLDTFSNKSSYSENDLNALNALRTSSALKNALITIYEHLPLAGIVKMTDPSGRSMRYNYDEYYRLTDVLNDSGSKLEAYEYNVGQ